MNVADCDFLPEISAQILFFAPLCERFQGIFASGIKLKKFFHFQGFVFININHSRFRIIQITHWRPAGPYPVSDFLPQTPPYILSQIIYKIF
ncbi:MAG: hypothetical protein COS76_02975 [Candidatus Portnoybacteria bacterium CG06_land_8_20_14_3_00_39_12]|uniref:Uncharacterized protein n=1 Tax=Candidatus Portnoybacteria bacterium CG06_land_8_20_14_3_00_39_12 TaxID=1974809 RepID=A0A2M7AWS2_9BACT|nr:MAG: hypothetical protein AUJ33_03490 [Parcubacteria group bacterium CG1_02_40_25]PIU75019.1 MAG: hypothetical protein COS76_02975 [Candidatus Portnoybacteria bacterium CG06_land_8_20_14_3_00_39_12]